MLPPAGTSAAVGDTATEIVAEAVTVSVVDPLTPADAAWIVVVPVPTPLATPLPVIVATAVLDELHIAVLVRFCVVASLYVPMAVNACVVPLAIDGLAGVTAIETSGDVGACCGWKARMPVMNSPIVPVVAVNVAATAPGAA